MTHAIWIILSLLPSILWLLFFYKKDADPEPPKKILKIFLIGMISALIIVVPVTILFLFSEKQALIAILLKFLTTPELAFGAIIFAPITEEILKYFTTTNFAIKNPDCDEPTDLMIYAITVALGFAALENILYLFPEILRPAGYILEGSFERFIGATLLHALTSGLMGYFIALSAFHYKKRQTFICIGIILAIILHSIYNSLIMLSGIKEEFLIVAFSFLMVLFIIVSFCFYKAKKMKSICKI